MPLYPLGISRRRDVPSVPKQAAGSDRRALEPGGELACAFIDAPHQAVPPMLHATTLEAIHRRICVLPVRFGVALHDEAEIRSLLQERRHELLDHLSRLDWTAKWGCGSRRRATAEDSKCAASSARQSPLATSNSADADYQQADEDDRARAFDRAAIRGAAARLLSAMAEAAIRPVAPDPAGVPRRTRPRDGLSEPHGARPQRVSGRSMRRLRTVAAV